jgi:hypothetical protein
MAFVAGASIAHMHGHAKVALILSLVKTSVLRDHQVRCTASAGTKDSIGNLPSRPHRHERRGCARYTSTSQARQVSSRIPINYSTRSIQIDFTSAKADLTYFIDLHLQVTSYWAPITSTSTPASTYISVIALDLVAAPSTRRTQNRGSTTTSPLTMAAT